MSTTKTRLVMTLAAAGVPIDTINADGTDPVYMPGATQQQIAAGDAIIAAFDWSDAAQRAWEDAQAPERSDLRVSVAAALVDIDAFLAIADAATTAQVRAAVKRLAQIQRRVLVYLAKEVQ